MHDVWLSKRNTRVDSLVKGKDSLTSLIAAVAPEVIMTRKASSLVWKKPSMRRLSLCKAVFDASLIGLPLCGFPQATGAVQMRNEEMKANRERRKYTANIFSHRQGTTNVVQVRDVGRA